VSKDFSHIPQARSWRDIPQPMKPRTMSGGGRRRLAIAALRAVGAAAVIAGVAWAVWQVATVLRGNTGKMPAAARAVPVKDVLLITDGVLDRGWITRTLALPANAPLLGLDLQTLRARVLASGQVRNATLTLNFPDTLAVTISERSPVARIMANAGGGAPKELLVAPDGVVFEGVDFDPPMIKTLPWLEGFTLSRLKGVLQPIEGMTAVAELLAKAKLEAEHLYQTWDVVSLARLRSDGEIEVRSRNGTRITFGTREDYFPQLARLDLLLDTAARLKPGKIPNEINLANGKQVPVSAFVNPAPVESDRRQDAAPLKPATPASLASTTALPKLQINFKSEL
jgi:cell division protein FtsQ